MRESRPYDVHGCGAPEPRPEQGSLKAIPNVPVGDVHAGLPAVMAFEAAGDGRCMAPLKAGVEPGHKEDVLRKAAHGVTAEFLPKREHWRLSVFAPDRPAGQSVEGVGPQLQVVSDSDGKGKGAPAPLLKRPGDLAAVFDTRKLRMEECTLRRPQRRDHADRARCVGGGFVPRVVHAQARPVPIMPRVRPALVAAAFPGTTGAAAIWSRIIVLAALLARGDRLFCQSSRVGLPRRRVAARIKLGMELQRARALPIQAVGLRARQRHVDVATKGGGHVFQSLQEIELPSQQGCPATAYEPAVADKGPFAVQMKAPPPLWLLLLEPAIRLHQVPSGREVARSDGA